MTSSLTNVPDVATLQRRIRVALGEEPGDLLIRGGRVVNVFTETVEPADVVVADGWIAGVGRYDWAARETINLRGELVLPGLIDAHMHLESTLLLPGELARLIVPRGTTTVVADPHEIANVAGADGIELLIHAAEGVPLDIIFMAPSCVPASPWESAGATLDPDAVEKLLNHPRVLGLAEMMNFPGVLGADPRVLSKVAAALRRGAPVDGHAPGLTGRPLLAYAAAGIRSDHESTTQDEGLQKAALGMLVQVREGSSARNLDTFLPAMVAGRLGDWCLASDDVHVDDLMDLGHLDASLRRIIAAGVPAARAIRHASLVPARHYGLRDRGAVAPGCRADLVVVDHPDTFRTNVVIKNGAMVARDGHARWDRAPATIEFENSVRTGPLNEGMFSLRPAHQDCPVIAIVPDQIVTRRESASVRVDPASGQWVFDPQIDLCLVACIERHHATGRVGVGLVRGVGFRAHGALASSVAHDAHNAVVAGTRPRDMLVCVDALAGLGGGFAVAGDGAVVATLPLPVAGLVSTENFQTVRSRLDGVIAAARTLGCPLNAPFGTLSFLSLSVIPELRITDRGVFDVTRQELVPL